MVVTGDCRLLVTDVEGDGRRNGDGLGAEAAFTSCRAEQQSCCIIIAQPLWQLGTSIPLLLQMGLVVLERHEPFALIW